MDSLRSTLHVFPPPGLSQPSLSPRQASEKAYEEFLAEKLKTAHAYEERFGEKSKPAYVVADFVDSSPPSAEEVAYLKSSSLVAQNVERNFLGPARLAEPDDAFDSIMRTGDVLKAAAAVQPSGPPQSQQDVWSIYRDLINSDDTQEAKPQFSQCQQPTELRSRQRRRSCQVLIATQLNALQDEDPTKVLMMRKINRLGFESAAVLKDHYERYGPVCKVLVSNSHEKQSGQKHRVRPSGIGFVVFENADDSLRALAVGAKQVVAGHEVFVSEFESKESRCSRSGSSDIPDGMSEEHEIEACHED